MEGSPTDCAAITPTASPGAASERMYLRSINLLKPSSVFAPSSVASSEAASVFRCTWSRDFGVQKQSALSLPGKISATDRGLGDDRKILSIGARSVNLD